MSGLVSYLTFIVLSKLSYDAVWNVHKIRLRTHRTLYSAVPAPMRPIIRMRQLARLWVAPPNVNRVAGDQRKRAEMDLVHACIRVGKVYLRSIPGIPQAQDYYIVRVDCREDSSQEKHMNPIVMWDLSASIRDFYRFREILILEVQMKHKDAFVPALMTDLYSFTQSEVINDVLGKRREVLQAFLSAVQQEKVLGRTKAFRKFCQAF